jgi:hypothetical protein
MSFSLCPRRFYVLYSPIHPYVFSSITWVPAIKIGHMRARWKGLCARIVLSLRTMIILVICACGLLSNPAKVPNFQYDGTLSIRNFMLMLKKPMDPNFEPLRSINFNGHDPAKGPKFKYWHNDGALSMKNFALNQAQLKVSHLNYFRGTRNFLLIKTFNSCNFYPEIYPLKVDNPVQVVRFCDLRFAILTKFRILKYDILRTLPI